MGFGEGVCSLHFERVLRGHDEERTVEEVCFTRDCDRFFLHRLEQGGLCFGGGSVDFVGEDEIGEERTGLEFESFPTLVGFHHDIGADHIGGHEIGGELDALEFEVERVGEGTDEEGFAEARHAFEEDVSPRDERGERAVDDLVLADDHLADFASEGFEIGSKLIEALFDLIEFGHPRRSLRTCRAMDRIES